MEPCFGKANRLQCILYVLQNTPDADQAAMLESVTDKLCALSVDQVLEALFAHHTPNATITRVAALCDLSHQKIASEEDPYILLSEDAKNQAALIRQDCYALFESGLLTKHPITGNDIRYENLFSGLHAYVNSDNVLNQSDLSALCADIMCPRKEIQHALPP